MIIELNITNRCYGKCFNCIQGCGLFPNTSGDMTPQDIDIFINQLPENVDTITVGGGEAFLNPYWKDIFKKLVKIRKKLFRPVVILYSKLHDFTSEISFLSENYRTITMSKTQVAWSNKTKEFFDKYDIVFAPSYNSLVELEADGYRYPEGFIKINNSILDFNIPYTLRSNECLIKNTIGFSYNKSGWYQCCLGGAIDRIFNYNLAAKDYTSDMSSQDKLCLECGYFTQQCFEKQGLKFESNISKRWQDKLN